MKVKISRQGYDTIPAWQTIYCSLILIMLVLFVMLSSYSVADKVRMDDLSGTIRGRSITAEEQNGKKALIGSIQDDNVRPTKWINDALNSLKETAVASGIEQYVVVEKTGEGLKCRLMADIIFSSGDAKINKNLYPYVNEIVRIVKGKNISLRIEGHTDNLPVTSGAFPSNWELSAARALSVLNYFVDKGEIPTDRLAAAGFGQYHPFAQNETPQGRAQNRRIEIFLEGIERGRL